MAAQTWGGGLGCCQPSQCPGAQAEWGRDGLENALIECVYSCSFGAGAWVADSSACLSLWGDSSGSPHLLL